eukprot:GILJ01008078.1.p1 GENE.GILJ01008078.1~~GILJ01008078.1.p1  ORF type:complete len:1003 (-),score=168.48 GILJ01008078.1:284-3292(-)
MFIGSKAPAKATRYGQVSRPLHLQQLASKGDVEALRKFFEDLENDASSSNVLDKETMKGALNMAVSQCRATGGHVECAAELLGHGAHVDAPDNHGKTLLMAAAQKGQLEMLTLLLDHGGQVNEKDDKQYTPLLYAADNTNGDNVDIVMALLERGAHVNATSSTGQTALMLAVRHGYHNTAAALIEKQANVRLQDANGDTALHLAAREGHVLCMQLLLAHGVDIWHPNKKKLTATDEARIANKTECLELLMAKSREKEASADAAMAELVEKDRTNSFITASISPTPPTSANSSTGSSQHNISPSSSISSSSSVSASSSSGGTPIPLKKPSVHTALSPISNIPRSKNSSVKLKQQRTSKSAGGDKPTGSALSSSPSSQVDIIPFAGINNSNIHSSSSSSASSSNLFGLSSGVAAAVEDSLSERELSELYEREKEEKEKCKQREEQLSSRLNQALSELETLKKLHKDLNGALSKKDQQLSIANDGRKRLEEKLANEERAKEQMKEDVKRLRKFEEELKNLRKENERTKTENARLKDEVTQFRQNQKEIVQQKAQVDRLQSELLRLRPLEDKYREQLKKSCDLEEKCKKLQEQIKYRQAWTESKGDNGRTLARTPSRLSLDLGSARGNGSPVVSLSSTEPTLPEEESSEISVESEKALVPRKGSELGYTIGRNNFTAPPAECESSVIFQRLHQEVELFAEVMVITEEEIRLRTDLIGRISQLSQKLWPISRVEVYGSTATGLCLPWSDIDLVIMGMEQRLMGWGVQTPLLLLAKELEPLDWVESVHLIETARVPVLKIKSKPAVGGCLIDITVSDSISHSGLGAVKLVKEYIKVYLAVKPLVLVLKHFLHTRSLHNVYQGGLGSYALTLMVVSYLQWAESTGHDISPSMPSLGRLLIGFLHLYGIRFDYRSMGLAVHRPGMNQIGPFQYPVPVLRDASNTFDVLKLVIDDPINPGLNVGRSSFAIEHIKVAFAQAFSHLHMPCSCSCHDLTLSYSCNRLLSRFFFS